MWKIALTILAVALAEAQDCEADELQLLQGKKQQDGQMVGDSEQFPDLDKLGKMANQLGGVFGKGLKTVTGKLDGALNIANSKVLMAVAKTNSALVRDFELGANANGSISQNLTKFKALLNKTTGSLMPTFTAVTQQVTGALSAAQSTLGTLGKQEDLVKKLDSCVQTANQKVASMKMKAEEVAGDFAPAAEDKLEDALAGMDSKLEALQEETTSFTQDFDVNFKGFASDLTGAAQDEFMGADAAMEIGNVTEKVEMLLMNFQSMVGNATSGLKTCGSSVDTAMHKASKGFFGKIGDVFGHIFR
ncbi:unnamed protein product [Effrenium voratum]|uniref:Uncharacterized protein n=1 Tax=Effrenium voratum TaxID=2562239 RepID=A0AA36HZ45_9DINO|nr:unnamed protein product [Effrenium voratum]